MHTFSDYIVDFFLNDYNNCFWDIERDPKIPCQKDFLEKIGTWLLTPSRKCLNLGAKYTIAISGTSYELFKSTEPFDLSWKKTAFIIATTIIYPIFLLIFPVAAATGLLALQFSTSYKNIQQLHNTPLTEEALTAYILERINNSTAHAHGLSLLQAPPQPEHKIESVSIDYEQQENQEHPLVALEDVWYKVFHKLPESELQTVAQTSKRFLNEVHNTYVEKISALKKGIAEIVNFTQELDIQIQDLTDGRFSLLKGEAPVEIHNINDSYTLFQFDLETWSSIQDTVFPPDPAGFADAKHAVQECYFDLIEALAEFNIDSAFFSEEPPEIPLWYADTPFSLSNFISTGLSDEEKEESEELLSNPQHQAERSEEWKNLERIAIQNLKNRRLLSRLSIPEHTHPRLRKLFKIAQNTLKGTSIEIGSYFRRADVMERTLLGTSKPEKNVECALLLLMQNPEICDWFQYYRVPCGYSNVSMEHLIHKKEGDRLMIPGKEGIHPPIILRLTGEPEENITFEEELGQNLFHIDFHDIPDDLHNEAIAEQNDFIDQFAAIHGTDFIREALYEKFRTEMDRETFDHHLDLILQSENN